LSDPRVTVSEGVRITILVDNQAGEGLLAEHGLSMWIEACGKRILFDTGQAALESNARSLGVDLGQADILVLSHGHYDHTGGIPAVLKAAPGVEIYCHPGVTRARYAVRDGQAKPIGMPGEAIAALEKVPPEKMHPVLRPVMLSDRIGLTGPVPRATGFEDAGGPFFLDPEGKKADRIEDDLSLWILADEGIVVCAGCSHSGIVNTIDYVRRLGGARRVRAVVGGLHLVEAGARRLERTVNALRLMELETLIPCHCTGGKAVEELQGALGDRVIPGAAGMTFRPGSRDA
jgi:7,8-dihydropterin-6-yl-methyl-4-(beta-D-ribofuranosyl)aminobenzene 5'-phosphate synthase